jgi:hypothetical protein
MARGTAKLFNSQRAMASSSLQVAETTHSSISPPSSVPDQARRKKGWSDMVAVKRDNAL